MPNVITDNAALFIGLLRALLIFLTVWGIAISQQQQDATVGLLSAILPVVSLVLTFFTVKTTVPKTPSTDAPSSAIQRPPVIPAAPFPGWTYAGMSVDGSVVIWNDGKGVNHFLVNGAEVGVAPQS